ncbi:MAG: TauD/TfdA dioxygenase family protein [Acidimicrobiales bacterium]
MTAVQSAQSATPAQSAIAAQPASVTATDGLDASTAGLAATVAGPTAARHDSALPQRTGGPDSSAAIASTSDTWWGGDPGAAVAAGSPEAALFGAMVVDRLAPALGAEISGVDLAAVIDSPGTAAADAVAAIRRLLERHHVLFFPDQHLDLDHHVALGRAFGPLEAHPHLSNAFLQHPEIFELAASKGGIADEWHTDLTFLERPSAMSILHMVKAPQAGGDTMWSNLMTAFDELSPPLQELCEGLSALHDADPHGHPEKRAIHPVVRIHPANGRRALYVNEHFTRRIVELNHGESELLLGYLTRWVTSPRFTVRYRWREGTVAMWDNRCTQHFVLNDVVGERVVQRVTVMGDEISGPGPRWEPYASRGAAAGRHDRQLRSALRERQRSTNVS